MDIKLDSIDHVAIQVSDIDASIEWYQTSFACKLIERTPTSAMIQFANIRLSLVLPSIQQRHLAFEKSDADTYGPLSEQTDGRQSTMVADPTGNVIELIQLDALK